MNKSCYIVGAGSFAGTRFNPDENSFIIAADGGYNTLKNWGITPDIVVGDFDSLGYIPDHPHVIKHPVIKDDTDIKLAVDTACQLGYDNIYIYGATGGQRLDHTLANLQILTNLSRNGTNACIIDEHFSAVSLSAYGSKVELSFDRSCEGVISVFSSSDESSGINLMNLRYPLTDAVLKNTHPLGVSNEFIGKKSSVSITKGTILVLWYDTFSPMPQINR